MLFSWKGSGHEPGLKEKKERQSVNGTPEEQKGFRKKKPAFLFVQSFGRGRYSHVCIHGIKLGMDFQFSLIHK